MCLRLVLDEDMTAFVQQFRFNVFPRVILFNFFLFLLINGGLGFWGLILGFRGWGFQLMGFGASSSYYCHYCLKLILIAFEGSNGIELSLCES